MEVFEKQPEDVKFTDKDGRVSIMISTSISTTMTIMTALHLMRVLTTTRNTKNNSKKRKDKDLTTDKVQDEHFQLPFQTAPRTHNK